MLPGVRCLLCVAWCALPTVRCLLYVACGTLAPVLVPSIKNMRRDIGVESVREGVRLGA